MRPHVLLVTSLAALIGCEAVVAIRRSDAGSDALPSLPPMPAELEIDVRGDAVVVTFDPVAGARDYRIYVEPDPADVSVAPDGSLTIRDAIYRCAGDRPLPEFDATLGGEVLLHQRDPADALLGHVYPRAGEGRVAVYALGDPTRDDIYSPIYFRGTRVHRYVIDEAERARLVAAGWRDDGVQFYVPATGGDVALHQYDSPPQAWLQDRTFTLVVREGSEEHARRTSEEGTITPLFGVLAAPETNAAGETLTVPLYRVHWPSASLHDELAAGEGWLERLLRQGNQPVTALTWSGLTEPTTLVIEALDRGCPFTGLVGPRDLAAVEHAAAVRSIESARAASATGEVWINAQHPPSGNPIPTHRSRVRVSPAPLAPMELVEGFEAASEWALIEERTSPPGARFRSDRFDLDYVSIEPGTMGVADVLGQLWLVYSDWGATTEGMVRLAPHARGRVASGAFFHATMETAFPSTGRRYPQLMISTLPAPLAGRMEDGTTLNVMSRDAATALEIQLCDRVEWEPDADCPRAAIHGSDARFPAYPVVAEEVGFDRMNRLDVYLSTDRAYVLFDGQPYACAELAFPEGEVSLHFGATLFHSGVDESVVCADCPHRYLREHSPTQAVPRFDNLGFESDAALPAWDHAAFPCTSTFE